MKFEDKRSVMYKQSAGMSPLSTGILLANKKETRTVRILRGGVNHERARSAPLPLVEGLKT